MEVVFTGEIAVLQEREVESEAHSLLGGDGKLRHCLGPSDP